MSSINRYLQENLLALLVFDKERCRIIRGTVEPHLFGGFYKDVVARVYDYIDEYKEPPAEHIADLLEDKLESGNKREVSTYRDILDGLYELKETINAEYVINQLSKFVKRQSLRAVAVDLAKHLQKDTDASLEQAEELIRQANSEGLKVFDPGLRLSDTDKALAFFDETSHAFPTGIEAFDKRGFGPTRKEMYLYIADAKTGKCVAAGEKVLMSDGRWVNIEDFPPEGGLVPSINDATHVFEDKRAFLTSNGKKECFKVTTKSGRSVRLTANHPLLTKEGWFTVGELEAGTKIALPRWTPSFGRLQPQGNVVAFMAHVLAGGGGYDRRRLNVSHLSPAVRRTVCLAAENAGVTLKPCHRGTDAYSFEDRADWAFEQLLGQSKAGTIPSWVMELDPSGLSFFLYHYLTHKGALIFNGPRKPVFTLTFSSEEAANSFVQLLLRFGVVAKQGSHIHTNSKKTEYWYHRVAVSGKKNMEHLYNRIGMFGEKLELLKRAVEHEPLSTREGPEITHDASGMLYFDEIKTIAPLGELPTFDLSVEDNHNFVCNNVLVHNTWHMIHLAKVVIMNQLKVLHVTLEMSETKISQRYVQTLFAMAKRNEKILIRKFDKKADGFEVIEKEILPKFSMDDPDAKKKIRKEMERWKKRMLDNIIVKQFPTGMLSVGELEAYLDNLEVTEKFVPDMIIVDYPDLMKMAGNERRHSLGDTYKRLRGIAVARNCAMVVPTQSNRDGSGAKKVGRTNVSEAYTKIADADVVVTYSQTETEKALSLARLSVVAGRNDDDNFTVVLSQSYAIGQYAVDNVLMEKDYWRYVDTEEEMGAGQNPDDDDDDYDE